MISICGVPLVCTVGADVAIYLVYPNVVSFSAFALNFCCMVSFVPDVSMIGNGDGSIKF